MRQWVSEGSLLLPSELHAWILEQDYDVEICTSLLNLISLCAYLKDDATVTLQLYPTSPVPDLQLHIASRQDGTQLQSLVYY
jgi:hypothetical protein